jgi:hypothetical protein
MILFSLFLGPHLFNLSVPPYSAVYVTVHDEVSFLYIGRKTSEEFIGRDVEGRGRSLLYSTIVPMGLKALQHYGRTVPVCPLGWLR